MIDSCERFYCREDHLIVHISNSQQPQNMQRKQQMWHDQSQRINIKR